MQLSDRKKSILRAVIDNYIATAEPVGSKTITGLPGLQFSSATIRNEMSDLEALGYLEQPHTSAGRVPTHRGYRIYVDELMHQEVLSLQEMRDISHGIRQKMQELDRMISSAASLVFRLTNYTTYTVTPSQDQVKILRFDLFPVESENLIIVVVTDIHIVKNKLVHLSREISELSLKKLTEALNRYMTNLPLDKISTDVILRTAQAYDGSTEILQEVLKFLAEISRECTGCEVFLTGASHILDYPEYQDIIKARRLLEYLNNKEEISRFSRMESSAQMKIYIGPENVAEQLQDSSVIMASYDLGAGTRGLIGVVGPTRMDYSGVAARLSYFAKQLEKVFSQDPFSQESEKTQE